MMSMNSSGNMSQTIGETLNNGVAYIWVTQTPGKGLSKRTEDKEDR